MLWSITIKATGRFQLKLVGSLDLLEQWLSFVNTIHSTKATARKRKTANAYDVELSEGPTRAVLKVLYGNNPKYYLDRKYQKALQILNDQI